MYAIYDSLSSINVLRGFPKHLKISCNFITARIPVIFCGRSFSDTSKSDNKAVVKAQGTDSEQGVRVRLTRPSDVPRVLRFVREQACVWPGPLAPPSNLIWGDYVARTLAQGHSMLAEQHANAPRSEILGLALVAALCPWDADLLERWARCVQCTRSKHLVNFTAHCLRAPRLHENYDVNKILQVILIVPPEKPQSTEIAQALAKNAIKRGKDAGFPLVRFDINKDSDAISLGELNLKKEWQVSYTIVDITLQEDVQGSNIETDKNETENISRNFISVYTASLDEISKPL